MTEHQILRLGHHGDGIAAGPVYAPRSLPGEVVSGDLEGDMLTNVRIITPSENRVKPPCRHYKSCGGCSLQHASDAFVADWKIDVVRQALQAQGIAAPMRAIETSPAQSRRRAVISARRTKKGAMAGFHQRASDVIVEIPDCQLLDPALIPALKVAEVLAQIGASRKATLSVTATLSPEGLDIAATGGHALDGPLEAALGQEAQKLGLARLAWNGEVIATVAPPYQQFGPAKVTPPAGAFLQATPQGESALLSAVAEIVAGARSIIDLFAGCGTFSLPLASEAEVHAIEGDKQMMAALDAGWRKAPGLKKVTTEPRDLFRNPVIASDLKYEAVVIDPPRAGAEAQCRELARSDVPLVAFVSCNPVTFARDAAILLAGGYQLDWVQVVDQFRWSSHIEVVGKFSRAKS
ncbi:class I SAM-dependent RNA methyltransferase [Cognatishimia sp. SS12]|uniref:class I SAM-dependent RNA methyltransferase n=1 Tax=Cognatishimia sp. SS12 TaxID=2979465 RepID=UPI00233030A7|nr:class I SAM-dependent RNA methyltransferase [Cognatishimia sp. SS12]MDC0737713.1 class I SAM-dependent RNA methyltransferase [Cognatishimia sp. SS12]